MRLHKTLIFLTFLALLAGCTTSPTKLSLDEQQTVYEAYKRDQKKLQYWTMDARFTFRVDKRIHTGNIHWVNNGDSYAIKFSGPLDQGAVIITSDGKSVSLKDSKGYEGTATTAEAMLSRYTQYELPVSNLKYWLIGLPTPYKTPVLELTSQGYPKIMKQDAWTIEYQYLRDQDDYLLPNKIIITDPTMKVTLSIYDWKTSETPYQVSR